MRIGSLKALLLLLLSLSAYCQGAELSPGLILHLQAGDAADVRSARAVALYVPAGGPVSPFFDSGPFKARWVGKLLLEKRSRLVFTLEGTGKGRLLVDGEVLVEALGTSNKSKRLSSGEHEFVVEYEAPAEGEANLRLFWAGREFDREPVPGSVFRHNSKDSDLAEKRALRHGRMVLAEKRCSSCHQSRQKPVMPELLLKGPSLDGVEFRIQRNWLAQWIANPRALRASSHMPLVFQEKAEQKAADIAAYLTKGAPKVDQEEKVDPAQIKEGGHLFHEQGCIACHTLDAKGQGDRIGLGLVGAKFRQGALGEFLREPAKHYEGTRMPTFALSEEEGAMLECFLRSLKSEPLKVAPVGSVERGHALFAASGCANCHSHGEQKSTLVVKSPLSALASADCSTMNYEISSNPEEKASLEAFLKGKPAPASLGRVVPAEFSERQYRALRCAACHSRDGSLPLRERVASEVAQLKRPAPPANDEAPALKAGPPPLNYLGLKLRPEWRAQLFSGSLPKKVRPWMAARMPAFPSRAQALAAGFSHAAGVPAHSPRVGQLDPAKIRIGTSMTGVDGGLACGTCHGIGTQKAIAVFEGEGPNLRDAGARLSHEYFHLWMNDPPRLWPGTIMPKYAFEGQTPLTQHYEGDAVQQFEAIFHYLRSLSKK